MSKLYVILAILSTVAFVQSSVVQETQKEYTLKGLTAKQLEDLEDQVTEECRAKLNVVQDLVEEYYKQDAGVPSTPGFKKVLRCVSDRMGYTKDNKPVWDRVKLATQLYHQDSEADSKKALNIVDECGKIENEDLDERIYLVTKCTKEGYQKANLEW